MKQFIEIIADTNDGDYITKRTEISDKDLITISPVVKAIYEFKPYTTEDGWQHRSNFPFGETFPIKDKGEKSAKELYVETGLCTEDELYAFAEFCPSGDIHTITDVNLMYVAAESNLLK